MRYQHPSNTNKINILPFYETAQKIQIENQKIQNFDKLHKETYTIIMKTTNITTPSPIPTPEKAFKTIMKQINDVFNNEQFFDSSKFQKLLDKILQ